MGRMDDEHGLTIEELASQAGTATTTVRMYQSKGLLPAPQRRGRIGYYGEGHLARLRLIAQLQEQGFSLASIKRLIDAWESGRGLEDVLGLEAQVASTWAPETPVRLGLGQLRELFGGRLLTPAVIRRAVRMGLIGLDGTAVTVKSPTMLRIGLELARTGMPVGEALDELEALRSAADSIAERFTGVFERNMWRQFVAAGLPADQVRPLTESLRHLSALAEDVVDVALRDALRRKAGEFLAEQAGQLGKPEIRDEFARAAGLDL
jgi:DNA-binding transcriptional MerR regulator